ncbi:threonine/serine exporter family protein [Chondrinema litorale]|uniref:threonine/serine exporter family protein n=1 Tax=Chondrinema litorale TaxID=2994555 RepID=UPI002542B2BB|nr:threonine/serine exporter family protein [Chondrinema litorale]UZR97466.1 threonine/serine exporter family protein [Chondrinema litorale]
MDWQEVIFKGFLGGGAAVGFGILFNVPRRTVFYIFVFGLLATFIKNLMLAFQLDIVLASFTGAVLVGVVSLFAGKVQNTPPLIYAIPAVIPMVPGVFTYKMMMGIIHLYFENGSDFTIALEQTLNNALKATFIMMALSVGVSFPNLILRKESFHEMPVLSRENLNVLDKLMHKKKDKK